MVDDKIEEMVYATGVDGFNLANIVYPGTLTVIVDYLIPELQRRGLAQKEYAVDGGSFREQAFRDEKKAFLTPDWSGVNTKQDWPNWRRRMISSKSGLIGNNHTIFCINGKQSLKAI